MFVKNQSGNPNGRPRGAKNKQPLPRPDRVTLSNEVQAVETIVTIAKNEVEKLKRNSPIPCPTQLQAIKRVLSSCKDIYQRNIESFNNPDIKPSLKKTESLLIKAEDGAIQTLVALANNDVEKLKRDEDVPGSVQLGASMLLEDHAKYVKNKARRLEKDETKKVISLFSTRAK